MAIITFIKKILKRIPIAITQNQRYDRDAQLLLKKVCTANSNCIDVGCHEGEFTDWFLKYAPKGQHFGFEPIPQMYEALQRKYKGTQVSVFNYALSDSAGTSNFNYVISNPAYSGLRKRTYDRANEQDTTIQVQTERLDAIIDNNTKIDVIKIDVEGAELQVMQGAMLTIARCKPFIIFEHGLGASNHYGATPKDIWNLLSSCNMLITTMENYLQGKQAFTLSEFVQQFEQKKNYYFLAYGNS